MLQMIFTPIDTTPEFAKAAHEYEKIWEKDGKRIIDAFKKVAGLDFQQKKIDAVVYEGISRSGNLKHPMKLRASYPHDIKIGTLIHELSHRLIYGNGFTGEVDGLDGEEQKNLFLYDVWVELYGKEFAERNVKVESERKGFYDYEKAWNWALGMNKEERRKRLKKFLQS